MIHYHCALRVAKNMRSRNVGLLVQQLKADMKLKKKMKKAMKKMQHVRDDSATVGRIFNHNVTVVTVLT